MPFELQHRIELLSPNEPTKDSVGVPVLTYRRRSVRAALMSDRGRTDDDDGVQLPVGRRRYIVRHNRRYSTAWKARVDGVFYDVKDVAIVASERRRGYQSLTLERSTKTPTIVTRIGWVTSNGDRLVTDTGDVMVIAK